MGGKQTKSDSILSSAGKEHATNQQKGQTKAAFLSFDRNLRHTRVSGNIAAWGCLSPENMLGKKPDEADYLSDFGIELEKWLTQVFEQGELLEKSIHLPVDEHSIWLNLKFAPEFDSKNEISSVLVWINDITSQKQKEIQLSAENEQLRMAVEASDMGFWDMSVQEGTITFSRKWKLQMGYYPDELKDELSTIGLLLHPEDKDRVTRELHNFLKSESLLFETEFRFKHKNGYYCWIRSRIHCTRDENNNPLRLVGMNHDISTEKKAASELALFKQAILKSPTSVIITDLDGYIEFFNPSFCKHSGWSPGEIIGKKPSILKSGFHSPEFYSRLWKTLLDGNIWRGELKNKRKNGRFYFEMATIFPLKNNNGSITHFVKISEDVTMLKKMDSDLRSARRSAEIANIYKHNFLSGMSHKIRTPINGIIGFSDLLRNGAPTEEQSQRYLQIIEENSYALMQLIDQITDATRIETNDLKIKKESCSLNDIFIELKPQFIRLAATKGKQDLPIKFMVPHEKHHDVIFTDPVRLKQVISILFENALKQTETGSLEVGYHIFSDRKLQFYVQDTGAGISDEYAESLTDQLKNIDKGAVQKSDIGLGLTICKGLVRLLGGEISLKSKKGKGTIFFFTIPYDKIKVQSKNVIIQQSRSTKYDFSSYTILIAEDVSFNFEYLKTIFASTGANLVWAKDGIDVLKIFNSNPPDLILMDIELPEISGYNATRQIRKKDKQIPIIAQTGYTQKEDREKCLACGCNEVLVKPLKIEEVLTTVAKYLQKK